MKFLGRGMGGNFFASIAFVMTKALVREDPETLREVTAV